MLDFIKEEWMLCGFVMAFFSIVVLAFYFDGEAHKRLMTQCMNDGHKEYECVSMLRNNQSTVVVPMAVPIR